MDMMDNAKRVAHMPTATIIEAGIRFKIGLKLPTRVHDEALKKTRPSSGHAGRVWALALMPNGLLASGGSDNYIKLWDINRRDQVNELGGHSGCVRSLVVLHNGLLASAGDDNTIRLWDVVKFREVGELPGLSGSIWALAVLSDGRIASAAGSILGWEPSLIQFWDPATRAETHQVHTGSALSLAVLPDGRLASGGGSMFVETSLNDLWDQSYNHASSGQVSGATNCLIQLWNPESGDLVDEFRGHTGPVNVLLTLPDGRLVSGADDHSIRLWKLGTGAENGVLAGHCDAIRALAMRSDGRLASCGDDHTVRIWDTTNCSEICRLELDAAVLSLAALPNGQFVAGDRLGRIHWLELIE
jgi:WD40 repeat protein